MTKQPLAWLVLALVGWIVVTGHCSDTEIAEALAKAQTYEQAAERAAAERDSLHAQNLQLAQAVESARLSEQTARALVDSVARDVALRSARAAQAAREASDTLRASLTASQAAQLDRIESEWAAVVAAKDEQVAALEGQVATLYAGIGARDAVITGLGAELEAERAIRAQLTLANGIYRGALRRQRFLGSARDAVTVLAVGYVGYRLLVPGREGRSR